MTAGRAGVFLGVGVSEYDHDPDGALPEAVRDVALVRDYLQASFDVTVLQSPTRIEALAAVEALEGRLRAGGSLVVLWSGHGRPVGAGGLGLMARDTKPASANPGLDLAGLARSCAASGADQILVIIDTCFSGVGLPLAVQAASLVVAQQPPDTDDYWLGVLTSTGDGVAYDGELAERLRRLLAVGPEDAHARVRWSEHNALITGEDLARALRGSFGGGRQKPHYQSVGGYPERILPNPLYRSDARAGVVEFLLNAARGGRIEERRSWFTGRHKAMHQLVDWLRAGRPGLLLVTGSPGTGKSALLGRLVSLSDVGERDLLLHAEEVSATEDPGPDSVLAHVHARRLSADAIAAQVDAALSRRPGWVRADQPRDAAQLLTTLARRPFPQPPVVVVDGIDEARSEAFDIARSLLVPMSAHATLVVSSRRMTEATSLKELLRELDPLSVLDLDEPELARSGLHDMHAYVVARLTGKLAAMDPVVVADTFIASESGAESTAQAAGRPFLLARLVTEQLRDSPVDTSAPGWSDAINATIEQAYEADVARELARLPQPQRAGVVAQRLMWALPWAAGAGFPEAEWLAVAGHGFPPDERAPDGEDLTWFLDALGRYVVQDGEHGQATYRVFHQTLADHVRPPHQPTAREPFDPDATGVADVLVNRSKVLLRRGNLPAASPYLQHHLGDHLAAAGPQGLDWLADLAGQLGPEDRQPVVTSLVDAEAEVRAVAERFRRTDLLTRLAMLRADLPDHPWRTGSTPEDPSSQVLHPRPAGDSVTRRATIDPDAYSEASVPSSAAPSRGPRPRGTPPRLDEAAHRLAAALEGDMPSHHLVTVVRELVSAAQEEEPASDAHRRRVEAVVSLLRHRSRSARDESLPLAQALAMQAALLRRAGQLPHAQACLEEASSLLRSRVVSGPEAAVDLGAVLVALSDLYAALGRPDQALAAAQEASTLYQYDIDDPPEHDLLAAWSNLSIRLAEVGEFDAALETALSSLDLTAARAAGDPDREDDHVRTLVLVSNRLGDLGRHEDALQAAEHAMALLGTWTGPGDERLWSLVPANLSVRQAAVGRLEDALATAAQVVGRERAHDVDRFDRNLPPDVALPRALANLANRQHAVGLAGEAMDSSREAVDLMRAVAADDPGQLPELARLLNAHGTLLLEAGDADSAQVAVREAVDLRREQAASNPAYRPELIRSLNNLASALSQTGDEAAALEVYGEAVDLAVLDNAGLLQQTAADVGKLWSNLAELHERAGRFVEARGALGQARAAYEQLPPDDQARVLGLADVDQIRVRLGH